MKKFAGLLLILTSVNAQAASFDCGKASHPLETTICGNAALSKLDEEVAAAYQQKKTILFDTQSLRAQQGNWQAKLRNQCTTACATAAVEKAYKAQLATLKSLVSETYEASYKTSDIATLSLEHLDTKSFAFLLKRTDGDTAKTYCALPASDGDAGPIAKRTGADTALWHEGNCTLEFTARRNAKGDLSEINVSATPGCKTYCRDKRYSLEDRYMPANASLAKNQ